VLKDAQGNPIPGVASQNFVFSTSGGTSTGTLGLITPGASP
jgi:hypothetical protein